MTHSGHRRILMLALALGAASLSSQAWAEPAATPQYASEGLVKFQERYAQPTLVKVAPNVLAAFAYSYSNFGFIIGKTGVIVVDTGWFTADMEKALADLRKVTDKPISAIIYTHPHGDHLGGAQAAKAQAKGDIPIIGPSHFVERVMPESPRLSEDLVRRGYSQMGLLLPAAGLDQVGSGVGPVAHLGPSGMIMPNRLIDKTGDTVIDGVRMKLIRTGGDVPEALMIWLPDQEVLFIGDMIGGIFPYIETPRMEMARNPRDMLESLDLALTLNPAKIVSGHGRVLLDRADARDVMLANRDVIQFQIDQVDRMVNKGMSAEAILHAFRLPPALASHPDLQPHYHKVDWMVRSLIAKRSGFNTETMDLIRLDGIEEAKRMVALMGGSSRVVTEAGRVVGTEPRWAARLANMVLLNEPQNEGARRVRLDAYRAIASETVSANERSYLLSDVEAEEGKIDWNRVLQARQAGRAKTMPTAEIMDQVSIRVLPEKAFGEDFRVAFRIGSDEAFNYHLRNAVLAPLAAGETAEVTITMPRPALEDLYARKASLADLIKRDDVTVSGSADKAARLAGLLES